MGKGTSSASSTAPAKLITTAADMRRFIERSGARWVHRRLPRGLELVLQTTTDRQWRLALARPDTAPSPDEIAICQQAFNVPAGTEATLVVKERKAKTGTMRVHVAEMYWTEME